MPLQRSGGDHMAIIPCLGLVENHMEKKMDNETETLGLSKRVIGIYRDYVRSTARLMDNQVEK